MNSAASTEPTGRRSGLSILGHIKSLSRLRLRQPVRFKFRWPEQPPDTRKTLWRCLLVTLGADGLVAVTLAVCELTIATTPFALLGAGILSAVGIANFWALNSLRQASPARRAGYQRSWETEAFVAQVLALFLALYIVVIAVYTDLQAVLDALNNWRGAAVFAITGAVGLLALVWIFLLGGRTQIRFTKTAVLITALVPLSGLAQFWLQNYYLPGSSAPQVDISTDLSPQGKTGSIFHLSAKVTMHNRSAANVNVAGALMRVTAYPKKTHQPEAPQMCRLNYGEQQWCQIEGGVDISGANYDADFRADRDSTPATDARLLYAGLLMSGPSIFMTPGETDTLQRVVDLDSTKFRLARLSVSAVFLPNESIKDIISCWNFSNVPANRASAYTGLQNFSGEVGITGRYSHHKYVPVIDQRALQQYLCMNYEIAPNDVISWLMGRRYVVQFYMNLNDPQDPANEYPQIGYAYGIPDPQSGNVAREVSKKTRELNPMNFYQDVSAEYAPGDPIQPKDKG
jgi:hypothetical protein